MNNGMTLKTEKLITDWCKSAEYVAMKERELVAAKEDLQDAKNILGEHMMPGDALFGENIGMWIRDKDQDERFLSVTKFHSKTSSEPDAAEYELKFRNR